MKRKTARIRKPQLDPDAPGWHGRAQLRFLGRMLALWLPLAGLAMAESPAAPRILEDLPAEVGAEERQAAEVVVSGEVAAVRLPSAVYLLERDAEAGRWRPVTRISAAGEAHFGDAMLLTSDTLLVAAPDVAGAGLGPGMAYVFQRHVGGSDRWGLVARLTPAAYPPPGAVEVRQLAPAAAAPSAEVKAVAETPAAEPEPAVAEAPPVAETGAPAPAEAEPPGEDPAVEETAVVAPTSTAAAPPAAGSASAETVAATPPAAAPTPAAAPSAAAEPAPGADLRYIVVANMREKPRALALASSLRDRGYPSEVYPNDRGFFIVTLARLPRVEARRKRAEAIAAGDIPADAYLILGSGFRERISP